MLILTEFNAPQPVFGMALGSHLERGCREIASVVEECVTALLDYGLEEEVCYHMTLSLPGGRGHTLMALSIDQSIRQFVPSMQLTQLESHCKLNVPR